MELILYPAKSLNIFLKHFKSHFAVLNDTSGLEVTNLLVQFKL